MPPGTPPEGVLAVKRGRPEETEELRAEAASSSSAPKAPDVERGREDRREDGGEEGREVKVRKRPATVSQKEVEEHNAQGHILFRDWCAHCVRGSAQDDPHFRNKARLCSYRNSRYFWDP